MRLLVGQGCFDQLDDGAVHMWLLQAYTSTILSTLIFSSGMFLNVRTPSLRFLSSTRV
jgi:hypothetical protein